MPLSAMATAMDAMPVDSVITKLKARLFSTPWKMMRSSSRSRFLIRVERFSSLA